MNMTTYRCDLLVQRQLLSVDKHMHFDYLLGPTNLSSSTTFQRDIPCVTLDMSNKTAFNAFLCRERGLTARAPFRISFFIILGTAFLAFALLLL